MAASQATLELRNNSDPNFRLWGDFIENGLIAGGWTKVYSDYGAGTGWTDVAAPAQNTFGVTEIWKSPDEVGLTNFYLKLRYGSHNSVTVGPALEWSVSWAWTSGSSLGGTPTTAVDTRGGTTAASSTAFRCTIAAGTGYVAICLGGGAQVACAHVLTIERTKDSNLDAQDELAIFGQYATSSLLANNKVYTAEGYEFTSAIATAGSATSWYPVSLSAAQQVSRGSIGLLYFIPWRGFTTSPLTNFLGTTADTMGAIGEQVPFEVYGVSRNYMLLGTTNNAPGALASGKNGIILFQ